MKKSFLFVGSLVFLTSTAFAKRNWEPVCGFADDTIEYIRTVAGESRSGMVPCVPQQGESDRRMFFYPNGEWVIVYAFFTLEAVEKDVICVVDSGTQEDADKAMEWTNRTKIPALPSLRLKNFGQDPSDLVPLKKFRKPGAIVPSAVPSEPSVEA